MCTYNPSERQGRRLFLTSTLSSIGHYGMDVEAMQVQGCGATPGTETWSDQCFGSRADRLKSKAAISPVFTGMRLLYLMLVVMMPALHPRPYPKRRLSDSGPPLLRSSDRRLEGAGSAGRDKPRPPGDTANHSSAYTRRGSSPTLIDRHLIGSAWRTRKYQFYNFNLFIEHIRYKHKYCLS